MTNQNGLNEVLQRKVDDFVAKSLVDSDHIYRRLESRSIDDMVIPNHMITFVLLASLAANDPSRVDLSFAENGVANRFKLNRHSAGQIAGKLGLPTAWVADGFTGTNYVAESVQFALKKYMQNYIGRDNRFLLRVVDGVVRGFLSTAYKRMNTREIFMQFMTTARELGLPLIGAYESETRDYLEVLDPHLIWIDTPNNGSVAYARGMQLKNGDFGDSKLELRSYWKKAICLNGAIGQSYLKEVHLGSRLGQEYIYSIETINKETEVRALMVRDAMRFVFNEHNRQFEEAQIVESSATLVDLKSEIEHLPKLGVTKVEKLAVENITIFIGDHRQHDDANMAWQTVIGTTRSDRPDHHRAVRANTTIECGRTIENRGGNDRHFTTIK